MEQPSHRAKKIKRISWRRRERDGMRWDVADSWLNATEPLECAITVTILNGFLTTFADL